MINAYLIHSTVWQELNSYRFDHWNSTSKLRAEPSLLVSGCRVYCPLTVPSITTRSIWMVTLPSEPCQKHSKLHEQKSCVMLNQHSFSVTKVAFTDNSAVYCTAGHHWPCQRHFCFCKKCEAFDPWVGYQMPKQTPAATQVMYCDSQPATLLHHQSGSLGHTNSLNVQTSHVTKYSGKTSSASLLYSPRKLNKMVNNNSEIHALVCRGGPLPSVILQKAFVLPMDSLRLCPCLTVTTRLPGKHCNKQSAFSWKRWGPSLINSCSTGIASAVAMACALPTSAGLEDQASCRR